MECTYARTSALERGYGEVAARAFKGTSPFRDRTVLWMKRPRYDAEHTRVVVDEGRVVAGVAIVEHPVRYGDAVLRLGGISTVATDPDTRKRGYARACMQDTVDFMARDGFDVSFLLGIRDFYHRFGYRTALVWSACQYNAREFDGAMPPKLRTRKMRRSDIPALRKLHDATVGLRDLSVRRSEEDWRWYFRFAKIGEGRVIVDDAGHLVAYFVAEVRSGSVRVNEVAVEDRHDAYDAVLATLRSVARDAFAASADMFLLPDCGFERYCVYKKRMAVRRWSDYEGGPMLRLMNVEPLFGKVASTLSRRWSASPRNVEPEAVTLVCPMGRVALVPSGTELEVRPGDEVGQVVYVPDEAMTEMFMGFRPVADNQADADIPSHADVGVEGNVVEVLQALFPVSIPYMSPMDHM